MKDAKFIVVQDINTANKLISAGFQLVAQVNNTYTFMNVIPKHFKFENIDIKKLAYTNMLSF
jgi:hypothetical protein